MELKSQGEEVAHTEKENDENKDQLDQSRGKVLLESGTTVHAQETACTKKGAKHPIRRNHEPCVGVNGGDHGIEKGACDRSDKSSEESCPAMV